MEERQAIEHPVRVHDVGDREHLPHVGEEIGVREFDALGHAFRTLVNRTTAVPVPAGLQSSDFGLKVMRRRERSLLIFVIWARKSSR